VNYRLGLNRAFCVATVGWYIIAGIILFPKWDQANHARQEANRILLGAPDEDGTIATFTDELVDLSGFKAVSKSSDPAAKYGGYTPQSTPASKEYANTSKSKNPASSGNLAGASLGDSRTDLKKKLSPMRFDAWQTADNKASELRPIKQTAMFLFAPAGIYVLFIAGRRTRLGSESKFGVRYRWGMSMNWTNSIRHLNIAQRIVIWLGGVLVLLSVLYPQFQTSYYAWVGGDWVMFSQANKRMFIADCEPWGMPAGVKSEGLASYPELRGTFGGPSWEGTNIDRRDSLKIWHLIVQTLAVAGITAGLAWVLKSSPPPQTGQVKSD